MSEADFHSTVDESQCGASAYMCRCQKPKGHLEAGDFEHECAKVCMGSWTGTVDVDFDVVTYPGGAPADSPNPMAVALLRAIEIALGGHPR